MAYEKPHYDPEGHKYAEHRRKDRDKNPGEYYKDYFQPDHPYGVADPACPTQGEKWIPNNKDGFNFLTDLMGEALVIKNDGEMVIFRLSRSLADVKAYGMSIIDFLNYYRPRKKARSEDGEEWKYEAIKQLRKDGALGNNSDGSWESPWHNPEHYRDHENRIIKPRDCPLCYPNG